MQKRFKFIFTSGLLHLPDCLSKCVCSSPDSYPNRAVIVFIGQINDQLAAIGIIVGANILLPPANTSLHGVFSDIVRARPVSDLLWAVFLFMSALVGAFQQVW